MNYLLKGYSLVIGSYIIWGVLPIYWNLFAEVPPFIVLFHRVFWSMVLLTVILLARGVVGETIALLRNKEIRRGIIQSSFFLGVNWLTYIWAMGAGEFVAASMGYFLCPILTIALGAMVCKEPLSRGRQLAVAVLLCGVAVPVVVQGELPWIALVLAGSWSGYTLVRKQLEIGTLQGVFLETLLLTAPLGVIAMSSLGADQFFSYGGSGLELALLVGAGVVTAVPQIALVSGARLIPLSAVGVLQYLAPTIMLIISAVYFSDFPSGSEGISIGLFWIGIALFFVGDRMIFSVRALVVKSRSLLEPYCLTGQSVFPYFHVKKNVSEKDAA